MDSVYVDVEQIEKEKKEILVFGAGADATKLVKKLNKTKIIALLDNYRGANDYSICGVPVVDFESYMNKDKYPIVIASKRYAMDIAKQLDSCGFEQKKNYYIWDEEFIYHKNEIIRRYIKFNKGIWSKYRTVNRKKKVLIPFYHMHNIASIMNTYFSNYFASLYDAEIVAFFRGNVSENAFSDVMKEIWESCNVSEIVAVCLDEEKTIEAKKITNQIWSRIQTWEDWKNIIVYDIEFGTTIIRSMLKSKIPDFDPRTEHMKDLLFDEIKRVVYWKNFFDKNEVCAVLLDDGISYEGYPREFATKYGIPVYAIDVDITRKIGHDYYYGTFFEYYKGFWNKLSPDEKRIGIDYAKNKLRARFLGDTSDLPYMKGITPYGTFSNNRKIIKENDKIKVLICAHIFGEDSYQCGPQIFDNNYISWLQHIGELSNKHKEYDWYIKAHPSGEASDEIILKEYIRSYPRIKAVPVDISPIVLREEGIKFALTVSGTVGHEYPLLGITVINAGNNPHMMFDFDYNPSTKKEFDELIESLPTLREKKTNEIYQYYCMEYLYYDRGKMDYRKKFFDEGILTDNAAKLWANNELFTYKNYGYYLEQISEKKIENIMENMGNIIREIDEWSPEVFYKKSI